MGRNTGDINDRSTTSSTKSWPKNLARKQHPADEIEVKVPPPSFESDLFKFEICSDGCLGIITSRRIDQNGGGTEFPSNIRFDPNKIITLQGIRSKKKGLGPESLQFLNAVFAPFTIAAHDSNGSTGRCKGLSHGPAERSGCPNHHGHVSR